ncbi:hypothetical protein DM806_04345 [Sphingobium lactosutens]|uniref:hypothetical protein n=1 Tax=Sphingobium lactosutens TaxID=522773 RepID=UPI0015B7A7CF|nr:hypothetical protein [Sphingobium lactosutens]NWK94909.1 hypothetical protein [Sphingobium lactosutens]
MDFSGFLVIPLSAVIMAVALVSAEIVRWRGSVFRLAFAISYILGLLLIQPWWTNSATEIGMSAIMLLILALWVVGGCIIGAIPAMLLIAIGKWMARR